MRGPYRGCEHFGTMLYGRRRAECRRCGAAWVRQEDGPWKLVDRGSEPSTPDGFVCDGCGARARIAPRTCLVCGRPSRGLEAGVLEAVETAAGAFASSGRRHDPAPLDEPDGGMRAD